jgi:hypothetical protein
MQRRDRRLDAAMARIELNTLPDDARAWVFGISPKLDEAGVNAVNEEVGRFIAKWSSHGEPIVAAAEVIDGSFLLVAITPASEASGCSIDRMFGLLRELETRLSISLIDADRIFFRDGSGDVRAVPRRDFRTAASLETRVFDTTAERLGEIRSGSWERAAADSWHARLLG